MQCWRPTVSEQENRYKYYLLNETTPARVTFNNQGLKIGAEAPDAATRTLVIRTTLLSKIETADDVDEIDRQTFETLCNALYAKSVP